MKNTLKPLLLGLGVFVLLLSVSCSGDDPQAGSGAADDEIIGDDDTAAPDDDLDDDTGDDDAAPDDDTTAPDDDGDDDGDDDTANPNLPMPPDDGRLYVAAGRAVITPNEINHPGPIYMGGTGRNRVATGVHDDLLASVLILAQGGEHAVLVSLDLIGFPLARTKAVGRALGEWGLDPRKIFVASTHNHEGPDTVGVWGPDFFTSGASPEYGEFITETVVGLVLELWDDLRPAVLRAEGIDIFEPGSNHPALIRDSRHPKIPYPRLSVAQFLTDAGTTIATLVNWHSHPEVTISSQEITADFPRWVRERLEDRLGGTSIYISGAVGGLATPLGVQVPARDEDGEPVLDDEGEPVYLEGQSWEKSYSLGYVLADYAMEALENAEDMASPPLSTTVADFPLPVRNPAFILAMLLGLVERPELIWDQPFLCGFLVCLPETIGLIRFGPVAIVTSPGETFSETLLGRPASTVDYGDPWNEFQYSAIEGYEQYLNAPVPMHMALCGDEMSYFVPAGDFHLPDHPDYYEEGLAPAFNTESLYRRAVIDLITGRQEGP